MSSIVERALTFYLQHPEVVDEVEASHGRTHQVYVCPDCHSSLLERDGEMVSLKNQPGVLSEDVPMEKVRETLSSPSDRQGEEELVPC